MTALRFESVHHVNFSVSDPDFSAEWYRRVLNLLPGWETDDVDGRGRKIVLLVPDSPLRIVLTKHESNDGEPASEFRTGLDHIALMVADREVLDAWSRHLDEHEVPRSPVKEGATGWLVTFRDPDNIQFEVYTASK